MIALTLRAVLFTVLVPGTLTVWLPFYVFDGSRAVRYPLGWVPIAAGATLYFWCAAEFLLNGHGTPNIFFARALRFAIGVEPQQLVRASIYRYSRNPMYLGVVTVLLGEALLCGSWARLAYAGGMGLIFQAVVVWIEEPHLRQNRGAAYLEYCRNVPRWIPWPSASSQSVRGTTL
ncbi:MAG: isoprenylcysteine carboxylmethyltransferase family protein [Acidobacteriia bacterium]|nr:isoprenylcysteine carboxylmethyltransferase family protein [Terriglobia bacterium]